MHTVFHIENAKHSKHEIKKKNNIISISTNEF